MAFWRAQGLVRSQLLDASLARHLAISTSPQEWASSGAVFLDQRKYEVCGRRGKRRGWCWLAGWLAGWMDGWLAGWLDGWLAGWLAGDVSALAGLWGPVLLVWAARLSHRTALQSSLLLLTPAAADPCCC